MKTGAASAITPLPLAGSGKILLAVVLAFSALLPGLLLRPAERQQELRVLVVARNMLVNGDWLRPEFQNKPRFRKPPLAYWMSACSQTITGVRNHPAAGRVFHAFAVVGVLALLADLARRISGGFAIPWTVLAAVLSTGFLKHAPLAETDFPLVLGNMLAVWAWQRKLGWLAGLGVAIGLMAKGPAGVAIPALTFIGMSFFNWKRDWTQWLSCWLPGLMLGGAWFLWLKGDPTAQSAFASDLNATFRETAHPGPWYYYLYTAPKMLIPGSLLPLLAYRSARQQPFFPLALTWGIGTLVLLSCIPSKQDHYALLLLPANALWMGHCLRETRFPLATPRALAGVLVPVLILIAVSEWMAESDARKNEQFLRRHSETAMSAENVQVAGTNSAVFDFALGRHVYNHPGPVQAWNATGENDALFLVDKKKRLDASGLPPPSDEASDDEWLRQMHRK